MKAVIVGCGRVGAAVADQLDRAGHDVLILDRSSSAFGRLPSTFGGKARRGDGTDEDVLRREGAEGADLFLALTEGDNRNIMAAQLASEALGAKRTLAKVNDPVRSEAYGHLGVATVCRTNLMTDALLGALGFEVPRRPGVLDVPPHAHGADGRIDATRSSATASTSLSAHAPATPSVTATTSTSSSASVTAAGPAGGGSSDAPSSTTEA